MAAHERLMANSSTTSPSLFQQLASVLPKGSNFKIHHLSTPPTRSSAIYSAPPGHQPDRTYCETHFLTASIPVPGGTNLADPQDVLVYAVEIMIYSTAHSTTFFVSKADSTGYLHLLGLPKGTPSPIRDITVTFLQHLIDTHERKNILSIVSLFARAQDQYLFPGSVEYSGKHVLDDRGLVRWWCRVLDPLLDESTSTTRLPSSPWATVKGYLIVPGLDSHEARSFIPRKLTPSKSWTMGHPLKEITRHTGEVPPRCLIPHFPDDPKARFLDELDEELSQGGDNDSGQWRSLKSIEEFWDMMAFRQECSAGRMVGFIWVVLTPKGYRQPVESSLTDSQSADMTSHNKVTDTKPSQSLPTPATSFDGSSQYQPTSLPKRQPTAHGVPDPRLPNHISKGSKKKKLTGPIIPREPRIKTENNNHLLKRPESTAYYIWRPEGRGQIIIDETDYKRVHELLLRLDFANLELAISGSRLWINEVKSGASADMRESWGQTVTGTKVVEIRNTASAAGVNSLNTGLVRKKRKAGPEEVSVSSSSQLSETKVNTLSGGIIRKKVKV